ncbi:LytR C-terminal domain-containing protein [Schaalia sp. 19OD2882]|uniref:LytR C-terminal domain-containing protein n=1 Tax=Schaalia sp. 19OD2882 TaxID=2794089 RepID=UPI001C1EC492|nr:LytR C-terminal domain-containing protein [Schaalia sp. 19OD2882]QWW19728.1 LytR C-terminal domain-containing protein [Schaalia sp. 19OD2882]
MSQQSESQSPRERFRRERMRKQSVTFLVAFGILSAMVGSGLLGLQGILPLPFPDQFTADVKYAEVGDTPCPTPGALPSNPADVRVQVLNSTSRQGLAKVATDMLVSAGYKPLEAGNSSPEYPGRILIQSGPAAVDDAYTVARLFPRSKVALTAGTDKTVTVELGTFYAGAVSAEELAKATKDTSALKGPETCLPLNEQDAAAGQSGQSGAQSGSQSGN